MQTEQTPIFEALVAKIGDPIQNPAVDRSFAAIVKAAQSGAGQAGVPAPAARRKVAAAARKSAG